MSVSVSWNSSFSPHRRVTLIICTKFQSINIAAICRTVYSSLTITDPLSKTAMHSAPIHRRQCTRFETKRNLYTLGVFLRRKSTLSEQQMRAGDLFQVWTIGHHHMTKIKALTSANLAADWDEFHVTSCAVQPARPIWATFYHNCRIFSQCFQPMQAVC